MVALEKKKISSQHLEELIWYRHHNILIIEDSYKFDDAIFIVTDYTTTTSKQVIAISLV